MKTLLVVRHAKSSWTDSELRDIDRPLKSKGVERATRVAQLLVKKGVNPDFMMSSPAVRAIHTALIFAREMQFPHHRIIIRNRLYPASIETYFQVLAELEDNVETVMTFGHDPAATNFVNFFLKERIEKITTSGVVGFQFDVKSWAEIKIATPKLFLKEIPKE
jgi:phosphohistidine phosphatase